MFFKKNYETLDVNEIDSIERPNVIDVRSKLEYQSMPSKKTKNVPLQSLLLNPAHYLDKDKKYYILCLSGARSASACLQLSKDGYDVVNLKGGFDGYRGSYLK